MMNKPVLCCAVLYCITGRNPRNFKSSTNVNSIYVDSGRIVFVKIPEVKNTFLFTLSCVLLALHLFGLAVDFFAILIKRHEEAQSKWSLILARLYPTKT